MSARMDLEELQTTKTEKFLAGVLAVFCLMAGVWAYQKIDDVAGLRSRRRLSAPAAKSRAASARGSAEPAEPPSDR